MSANPALADLLARLDAARARLGDAAGDPEAAVAALTEINELAQAAGEELEELAFDRFKEVAAGVEAELPFEALADRLELWLQDAAGRWRPHWAFPFGVRP